MTNPNFHLEPPALFWVFFFFLLFFRESSNKCCPNCADLQVLSINFTDVSVLINPYILYLSMLSYRYFVLTQSSAVYSLSCWVMLGTLFHAVVMEVWAWSNL